MDQLCHPFLEDLPNNNVIPFSEGHKDVSMSDLISRILSSRLKKTKPKMLWNDLNLQLEP